MSFAILSWHWDSEILRLFWRIMSCNCYTMQQFQFRISIDSMRVVYKQPVLIRKRTIYRDCESSLLQFILWWPEPASPSWSLEGGVGSLARSSSAVLAAGVYKMVDDSPSVSPVGIHPMTLTFTQSSLKVNGELFLFTIVKCRYLRNVIDLIYVM